MKGMLGTQAGQREEASLGLLPTPTNSLFKGLLAGVDVAPLNQGHSETLWGDDSPTGRPTIFINPDKYQGDAWDKMQKAEALHLLKLKNPNLHSAIMSDALDDPDYMRWARNSYDIMTGKKPDPETGKYVEKDKLERRSFNDWHNVSRFDQVMGGYILAGDPDFPTMKNWNRDKLPIGKRLRGWLEYLKQEFDR